MENIRSQLDNNGDKIPEGNQTNPGGMNARDAIRNMTGLDLDPDKLAPPETPDSVATPADVISSTDFTQGDPNGVRKAVDVPEPTYVPSGSGLLSAKDAEELGFNLSESNPIDYEKEAYEREQARLMRQLQERQLQTNDLFDAAIAAEDGRNARAEEILEDPEKRKEVFGEDPVIVEKVSPEQAARDRLFSGNPQISDDDLMPSYSDDETEEDGEKTDEDTSGGNDTDVLVEQLRNTDVAEAIPLEVHPVIRVKDPMVETVLSERAAKSKILGDTAFDNAIARFKKDRFGKTTVPLVNSGFLCDIVGTGVVDLQNLYMNLSKDISSYDYQLEQMRAVIKCVVGTMPKVQPTALRNSIHFADFQMMAYGHVCSTLRTVEATGNCEECGTPFRVSQSPVDLLLNADELMEKKRQIESAMSPDAISLMSHDRRVNTSTGIEITLGHPTFAETVRYIEGYQAYRRQMTEAEAYRFTSMMDSLHMVKKCKLPDGTATNSIYQNYKALLLLTQEDLDVVYDEIDKMRKEIVVPKFGIKKVVCPNCGHVNTDVPYENLVEMVFYHTTIKSLLSKKA